MQEAPRFLSMRQTYALDTGENILRCKNIYLINSTGENIYPWKDTTICIPIERTFNMQNVDVLSIDVRHLICRMYSMLKITA